jgi:2-aminoethylphosphonate-pyruvate transaminase
MPEFAPAGVPLLLTPGPLTTQLGVRQAMLRDWGSRDEAFIALTAEMRERLLAVAQGEESHVAVPLQGSGTFIVEAVLGTLVGANDKLLVLVNGAYGERMITIAHRLNRTVVALHWPEDKAIRPEQVDRALRDDPAITHVAFVHCETTTGLLNPLDSLAGLAARHGKALLVDAMSSFGALPINLQRAPVAAVMASSNKCLEGVPGLGFALIEKAALRAAQGNSPSLSLDLFEQWRAFEANGQWRFTPPVQVVAALVEALRRLEAEGGPEARLHRYWDNFLTLDDGMAELGFRLYLRHSVQAPIIATYWQPEEAWFRFPQFYEALARRGFLIYPGKLSRADTFRIGCIGALCPDDYRRLLATIRAIKEEQQCATLSA